MFAFAIVTMPAAASSRSRPSRDARPPTASAARSRSSARSPPRKQARVDPAQDDVRVGDRRLVTAEAVARRARHGAGAPGPDAERATVVDVGDRAAARADRLDVDHGNEERVAGDLRVACRGFGDPRSLTIPMSADVPPMSKVIKRLRPAGPPAQEAPRTPAAGPERSSVTGFSAAASALATPPWTSSRASPRSRRRPRAPAPGARGSGLSAPRRRSYRRS